MEAMPVKQWHDIDAPVGFFQSQRRDRAIGRRTQIGVREGTIFGRDVVPEVSNNDATSSALAVS